MLSADGVSLGLLAPRFQMPEELAATNKLHHKIDCRTILEGSNHPDNEGVVEEPQNVPLSLQMHDLRTEILVIQLALLQRSTMVRPLSTVPADS